MNENNNGKHDESDQTKFLVDYFEFQERMAEGDREGFESPEVIASVYAAWRSARAR